MARIPGSAHSIAAGFACGAAVSFTPFVGLHFVLSALLAYLLRVNILSSAIGTAVGNPWTFPFIWIWILNLGEWLLGGAGRGAHGVGLDFASIFAASMSALLRFDLAYLFHVAGPVLWPMLVGSIPTAIVAWTFFYLLLRPMISNYQKARAHRRIKKHSYHVGDYPASSVRPVKEKEK
ncbi:DUF2062 domain-containing protein [Varunaivibrio sulfuroxidans]|uniref:DUF2062 domain-containing protein n=1 Tax=Varunaivibrio sulfuroxidans TaxID=1773489 RepID=UPI00140558BD|nr:DUF2062 domain-containing protein [Varunaivibrio sulfuroxidans]WES31334.1 DUF2062 domain-containing protein [Varunaivibrio sulfuroxidans]